MPSCWVRLVLVLGISSASLALAQDVEPADEAPRGVHARAILAGHAWVGFLPEEPATFLVGGGLETGFQVVLHPNHDLGLSVFVELPRFRHPAPLWGTGVWLMGMATYRFHDTVRVDNVAPWIEIGGGIGLLGTCLRGDFCGGFGAAAQLGVGGELGLHRYASFTFGVRTFLQSGLSNGLSILIAPALVLGFRAG